MMSVKNHQIPPTILVERAFGMSSDPEREEQRDGGEAWFSTGLERGQHPGQARPGQARPGLCTCCLDHTLRLRLRHTEWTEWAASWLDLLEGIQ